ncbi:MULTISPECIES: hypothetical protein [Virgibacillus]|uniref:Uncharacterized protein n=1 Tax=Virgibacillus kapii TaxID=1638645 RepID=A0ABQ2DAX6_9BACI|nr:MULTISPECIES: hypothetical protein [Virgibacillus]EQB35264.1 hypothetical protein M948_19385 [Virgibacillus sp. CM-4]GGJ49626.1 hypothetical protein GCM10007111_09720 [Virgibacillus kapii]
MEKQRKKRNRKNRRKNHRFTYSVNLLLSPETKQRLLALKGGK